MLRNSHGVGIAPPAADRDELDGGDDGDFQHEGTQEQSQQGRRQQDDQSPCYLPSRTSGTGQGLGRSSSLCCPQGREVLRIWPGAGRTEACGRVSLLLPPFLCTGNEEARQRACLLLPGCICRDAGQVCAWQERRNLPYAPFWPVLTFSRVFV